MQPLAERLRPKTLDEYIGQKHLVGPGAVLRKMKVEEKDRLRFTIISSILLIACPMLIQFIFNKLTMVLN